MSNTSATGGFLIPAPLVPGLQTIPPNLTLVQFIQTVFVGISDFPGSLVRPMWQVEPPKQPDLTVDWMAFGIANVDPDSNAFIGFDSDNNPILQRQEELTITCSVYGPNAMSNITLIRDGFQIQQNLKSLLTANMVFAYDSPARHIPDFFNERWIDRYVTEIFLRRQVQRSYPILNFVSATGIIYSQTASNTNYQETFSAGS